MYRRLKARKDTYITNKIIRNSFRATDANVGEGATLDLFKLYNENKIAGDDTPIELTRILIKFDLNPLRALTGSILDIASDSFRCDLKLFDVFGGQTLPSNFKVAVFPLSRSFDEGVGRDVIKFQDIDAANFITSSVTNESPTTWHLTGANKQGLLGDDDLDIISSGNLSDGNGVVDLFRTQTFLNGTEDLAVNVTTLVSATLANQIPDYGFRISFSGTQETDTKTRFVKRFASRHNSNTRKRPSLDVRYADAIQDYHEAFFFNLSGSIFLNNFERGQAANILSGAALTSIAGNNCMVLKLQTGSYQKIVTASQHSYPGGNLFSTGVYSGSFAVDSFGSPITAASVVITVAAAVGDAETLTITDALGNSVAYTATGSQDLASNPPEFSRSTGGADATADSIKSCIESATYGHGTLYSSLTVDGSASGGAITVRQVYKGTDGNTECDASSVTNVTAVGGTDSTANQFDGGSDGSSVDNNNTLEDFIRDSGSVTFTTFWQSLDESVGYHTGSLKINAPDMTAFDNDPTRYTLNISNLKGSYKTEQKVRLRVVAYNVDEQVKSVKLPLYRPSIVLTKCFYRIRDAYSDDVVIPFDDDDGYDGTLMSTDSKGMYFDIFTDDLNVGRVFAIDIKIKRDNSTQVFKNVGGTFRIDP